MKNFRLNLEKSHEALKDSICDIKNPAVRRAVESIGGAVPSDWLKAHGDVTWEKGSALALQ